MNKTAILLTIVLASIMSVDADAQQTKLLTADRHNEYGLVYTLPSTSLSIEVTATKEVRKRGPYYQYAKKYIGTDNVVKEDAEIWTINSVSVTPYGVPDNEHQYLMQLKAGALTYIGVDANGMLLTINQEPEDATATIYDNPTNVITYTGKEYLKYVNEDFLASQSSAKQAQMLAANIMEVRDAKVSLTRGTADTMPSDGKQLELMLNSLQDQEESMMSAFTGTITRETVKHTYTYTPSESGKEILFRMSDFAGFVDADDYSGDPVYIIVDVTRHGELPVDAKGEEKKLPKDAVMYCIPGAADISIVLKGNTLFSKNIDFAQYGVLFGLNPALFTDKKEPSYAVFDSVTGALKEIGSVSSNNAN
jgi:hypothetical protein